MRSATVSIFRLCSLQNSTSCGTRDMVPSSPMISQMTLAGVRPAIRARSTEASVWPARTSTPPLRARRGKMWPGRARSCGFVFGSMAVRIVMARSEALIPVVTPTRAGPGVGTRGGGEIKTPGRVGTRGGGGRVYWACLLWSSRWAVRWGFQFERCYRGEYVEETLIPPPLALGSIFYLEFPAADIA